MSNTALAQWQFGFTAAYHFLFVPLTLGLSVLVAIMETLYVRTNNDLYKRMAQFWGKLFTINFAMGVVTGIVMVFQFGMNWSEYSRFVGDIFGIPLAIEALLAFFLESTFLGLWIFGWDKLSKKVHLLSIWLVAVASCLSSLWILIANSFMQNPVGFTLQNGRAELNRFTDLLTNPYVWHQFPHTVLGGFTAGGFFVLGISAYHLLKKTNPDFFKKSFKIALIFGLIAVFLTSAIGHLQGQFLIKTQPMKMAAAEAIWETEDPAPMSLFALINQDKKENSLNIQIPAVGSFLAYNSFSGEIKGLNDLQTEAESTYGAGNYIPPVATVFWSFRAMVGAATWMILIALISAVLYKRGTLERHPGVLKALIPTLFFPYITNTAGWILTEMGRQPWIVYGMQKVDAAASPSVSSGMILASLIGFALIYAVLIIADIYLLQKYARRGPAKSLPASSSTQKEVSLWT